MKTNLLKATALAIVMTAFYNCSVESIDSNQTIPEQISLNFDSALDGVPCVDQQPRSRISNNGDEIVNFEIFDSEGILLKSVYDLNPGDVSEWQSFPAGLTTFSVTTSVTSKPVRIDMGNCMIYDVSIDANYQLDTDVPIQL